ncbi:MAG: hypothetical protein DRJ63_00830 [Thermoprotei archaeon]|nr:MAG: hypothetical protein DRJ63_00830 [Thermoprotei archaeon]
MFSRLVCLRREDMKIVNTINVSPSERGDVLKSITAYLTSSSNLSGNLLLTIHAPLDFIPSSFHPEPPLFIKTTARRKIMGWRITPYLRILGGKAVLSYGIRIDAKYLLPENILETNMIEVKCINENIFKLNIFMCSKILKKFRLIVGPLPSNYLGLKYSVLSKRGCSEKKCDMAEFGATRVYIFKSRRNTLAGHLVVKIEGKRFLKTILPIFLQGILSKENSIIKTRIPGMRPLVLNRVNYDLPDFYLTVS